MMASSGNPDSTGNLAISWPERLGFVALWGMSVAQPLFSGLFKDGSFFSNYQLSPPEIVVLVLAIAWLPPVLALLAITMIGRLSGLAARLLFDTGTAVLVSLLILIGMRSWYWLGLAWQVALALFAGLLAAALIRRFETARHFLGFLAPAIVLFPLLCLWQADLTARAESTAVSARQVDVSVRNPAPVVMIVFDEFPLLALLDEEGHIDAGRFPNFSALAASSHWFQNAVTVHGSTGEALPAMLTGRYPPMASPEQCLVRPVPNLAFPETLFSLLQQHYRFHVYETFITLCPDSICHKSEAAAIASDYLAMGKIIVRSYLFEILMNRPEFDWWYYRFKWWQGTANRPHPHTHQHDVAMFESLEKDIREKDVSAKPRNSLYFLHVLLPHYNWEFYPSGRHYASWPIVNRSVQSCKAVPQDPFCHLPWRSRALHQRLLLQVGYVDRLVGRLTDRLKEAGMYDDALVIITADHGVSVRPGEPVRGVSEKNLPDIMLVPLFVKTPGQRQGQTHDAIVENIHLLPTIADVLGVELPWPVDGQSVFDGLPQQDTYGICSGDERVTVSAASLLERKEEALGAKAGRQLFNLTPYADVLGRSVPHAETTPSSLRATVLAPDGQAARNGEPPLHWFGTLSGHSPQAPVYLAVAAAGRVVSATEAYRPFPGNALFFDILLPEAAVQKGGGDIRLYEIRGPVDKPEFLRLYTQ